MEYPGCFGHGRQKAMGLVSAKGSTVVVSRNSSLDQICDR